MSNRIFQISLRTIFELTFVVAVVLAFVYWRAVPRAAAEPEVPPPGRYELLLIREDPETMLIFDTATGECRRRYTSGVWHNLAEPLIPQTTNAPLKP